MADGPSAAATGARLAPELQRLRGTIAGMAPTMLADLAERTGMGPAVGVFAMLRNLPGRAVQRADVAAAFVYQDVDVDSTLGHLGSIGLIELDGQAVRLTGEGEQVTEEIRTKLGRFVEDLWYGRDALLEELLPLAGRAVDAAAATGGLAFRLVAPVWEPAGSGPAVLLAERLTPLRFHRYDAHVAAWQAAGLSVAEVQALDDGAQRAAIEAETDRLGAAPYECLEPDERQALLEGIRRLPG